MPIDKNEIKSIAELTPDHGHEAQGSYKNMAIELAKQLMKASPCGHAQTDQPAMPDYLREPFEDYYAGVSDHIERRSAQWGFECGVMYESSQLPAAESVGFCLGCGQASFNLATHKCKPQGMVMGGHGYTDMTGGT